MLDTLSAGPDCVVVHSELAEGWGGDISAPAIDPDAVALDLPDTTPYPQWLALGRSLAARKRNTDWLIGDWINFGRAHYPEQISLALDGLGQDDRTVRRIEKTAKAFPPTVRLASLSFDHHAHVADMPTQEALPLLKQAHDAKWTARQTRVEAMLRKVDIGQILPREDDADDDALMACVRAWNRAPKAVREDFAEMVSESGLGLIEL